ncbi:MAG: DUF1631 family protein [Rhodanobacteraceae bacterium]|nr:DUF1631 family protein [Rhodanobacteraceae bacterium]
MLRRAGIQSASAAPRSAAKAPSSPAPGDVPPAVSSAAAALRNPEVRAPSVGFAAPDPDTAWSALRRIGAPAAAGVNPDLPSGGGAVADTLLLRAAGELLGARTAVSPADFRARLQQRARQLAGDAGAPLERRQHDAVDLVARIHEALDEDPLLPAGFRERCRPLLRSILASELHGEGLGESGAPLRKLLSLVEFGSALFASRQDPMTAKVRSAVDEELATLTQTQPWTKAQLEATCERLEGLLQRQRAASQASEKRVVDACEGQQRIADARAHVQSELAAVFGGRQLPQGLVEVLARQLSSTMLPILLRAGPDAPEWQEVLGRLHALQAALQRAAGGHPGNDSAHHLEWLHQTCAGSSDAAALERCLDGIEAALKGRPVSWPAQDGSDTPAPAATGTPAGAEGKLATLQVGDWLSLESPGEDPRLLKLAWRAADQSRFTLVNRLGQKTEEIDAASLQAMLGAGRARVVEQGDADLAERVSGIVARAAGDEFVLVLHGLTAAESERRAVALFDQANALELNFDGKHLRLSLSMGMVPVDAASTSVSRLLADAERACDAAKESGRGRWYRFQSDDALLSQMRESANWVRRLDESLQSRGLLLYGQRAVWLGSDGAAQPDYIEVLLRMQTADGVAAPGDFIIAAERYGQIAAVDRYVLQELTRVLQRVGTVGNARIAFNISARNIIDAAFVDEIIETLRQQPVPLEQLCVELTETSAIQQIEEAGSGMRKLAQAGLSMVLDDFGSGWSSYQYLRRLPFAMVKVDGAFIRDITRSVEDRALASSINEIAHLLGKRTVAEHVEDQETLDEVRAIGFDYAQGYLLGKPVPLSELLG